MAASTISSIQNAGTEWHVSLAYIGRLCLKNILSIFITTSFTKHKSMLKTVDGPNHWTSFFPSKYFSLAKTHSSLKLHSK